MNITHAARSVWGGGKYRPYGYIRPLVGKIREVRAAQARPKWSYSDDRCQRLEGRPARLSADVVRNLAFFGA